MNHEQMQMEFVRKLPIPQEIKKQFPISEKIAQHKAERDEANGREGAGEIADEGRLHGFTRYPTPRMVSMCAAQSPSFLRRPTSWTSTVRSVTDFSSSWIEAMIWLRV